MAFPVRTEEELNALAQAQVRAEIEGQVAPLKSQITGLETSRTRGVQDIGTLFGGIQASSEASARRVSDFGRETVASEQAIFDAATLKMNEFRGQRVSEAQALAQAIGGPIDMAKFTDPVDVERSIMPFAQAGQMLKASGLATAGVQYAEAFSGRVFPLLKAREEQNLINSYNDEIRAINDQIASLKGQETSLTNARANDLLIAEREYSLSKLQTERDWKIAKQSIGFEKQRLAMDKTRFGLEQEKLAADIAAGKRGDQTTRRGQDIQERMDQARMNFERETAKKEYRLAREEYARDLLDAAVNPGVEDLETSEWVTSNEDTEGAVFMKHPQTGAEGWYKLTTVKQRVTTQAITDPNRLYEFLISHGIAAGQATKFIQQRRIEWGDWVYGQSVAKDKPFQAQWAQTFNSALLEKMPTKQLWSVAQHRGARPKAKGGGQINGWTRNDLINYILASQSRGADTSGGRAIG